MSATAEGRSGFAGCETNCAPALLLGEMAMPIFYLHLRCRRELIRDEEGFDLRDVAAARREAIRGALSIMSAEVSEGTLCLDQAIQVHDEHGRLLNNVRFEDALQIVGADDEAESAAASLSE